MEVINDSPFNHDLNDQIAHLQRNDIQEAIKEMAKGVNALQIAEARQEEWRSNIGQSIIRNANNIASLTTDVATIKDLASRYKGGMYVIMALTASTVGLFALWDRLLKLFH